MDELKLLKREVEILTGLEDISIKTNKRDYVIARGIFFTVAKKRTPHVPLNKIGSYVGKDHAGVINSCNKLPEYLKHYPNFREVMARLTINDPTYEIEVLLQRLYDLENEIQQMKNIAVKPSYISLLDLINEVPEYHLRTVEMRLKPIVKMLEKPSRYNYIPK
jgi:hypothetical protein